VFSGFSFVEDVIETVVILHPRNLSRLQEGLGAVEMWFYRRILVDTDTKIKN